MIQQVYLQILSSYLEHETHCALLGRKFCMLGLLHVLKCITPAVLKFGLSELGWFQKSSIVTEKLSLFFMLELIM